MREQASGRRGNGTKNPSIAVDHDTLERVKDAAWKHRMSLRQVLGALVRGEIQPPLEHIPRPPEMTQRSLLSSD